MNVISPILNAKVCDKVVKKRHENERRVGDIEEPVNELEDQSLEVPSKFRYTR